MSSILSVATTEDHRSLLSGGLHFAKGVQVSLTPNRENVVRSTPRRELISACIELQAQALVLTQLVADEVDEQAFEEIF